MAVAEISQPKAKRPVLFSLTLDGLDGLGIPDMPGLSGSDDPAQPRAPFGTGAASLGGLLHRVLNVGAGDLAPVKINAAQLPDLPPVTTLGGEQGGAPLFTSGAVISTSDPTAPDKSAVLPDSPPGATGPAIGDPTTPPGDDQIIANLNIPDVQVSTNVAPVVGLGPVSAVPELSTWTLMVAGIGVVGGVLRRRRRLRLDL